MYPDSLCSVLCAAPCSCALDSIWTYRNISRAELGAQATHLTDKLDATLHRGPLPTTATSALHERATEGLAWVLQAQAGLERDGSR